MPSCSDSFTSGCGENEPIQLVHSKRGTNIYRRGNVGYKVHMCPEEDCQEAPNPAVAVPQVSEEQILKLVREQTISRILPHGCSRRRALDVKGFKGNPALYFQWVEGKSLMQWMNEQHSQEEAKANRGLQDIMERRLRVAISITKTLNDFHIGGVAHNFLSLDHIILQWTGSDTGEECCIASLINLSRAEVFAEVSEQETKEAIRKDLNGLGLVFDALFSGESDVSEDVERRLSDDTLFELDDANDNHEYIQQPTDKKRWKQRSLGDGLPTYLSSMISAMVGGENADSSGLYDNASDVLKDLQVAAKKPGLHLIPNVKAEERIMESLVMPNTFYGRRNEVDLLIRTMQTVAILGKPNIAVISGRGGAGKTTLINQIKKPLEDINGRFIQVKFDLNIQPDTVLFSALDSFIGDIRDDEEGMELKQRIKETLGSEMSVVANSIPSIAKLIDKSASNIATTAEVSMIHQQEQMKSAMCKLIGSIATRKNPVVMFLDDLHWADKSLDVIQRLFVSPDISHCFFLACYRDNDFTLAKPVESMFDGIQTQEGISIIKLPLGGLDIDCAHEFISETLCLPPNLKSVKQLANAVHHKTGGLIFYMKNFLCELCGEGLLCFELNRRWQFNLGQIMSKDIEDDVVEHLMQRIARLAKSRYLLGLRIASCLGSSFSVKTFQTVTDMKGDKFDDFVQFVESNGFIQLANPATMQWVHDNVQQAAYKTISSSKMESMHLLIGGRLLIRTPTEDIDECIFDIVHHMNKGINLIRTPEQKYDGARLNLRAGQKAMCSLSFHSASKYCISGIKILGNECWGVNYDLTIDLHNMAGKASLAIGDFESMKTIASSILANATCFEDEAFAHVLQMKYLSSFGQFNKVIHKCRDLLQRLDEPLPSDINENVIVQEYARTKAKLNALTEEDILALPDMTDKKKSTAMLILGDAVRAAVVCQPYLASLLSFRGVKLTLDHGVSSLSASCFASYGCWLVTNQISDFEGGFRMGQFATKLMKRQGEDNPRVFVSVYGLINMWRQPFQACLDMLRQGYELAMRQGNIDEAFNCLLVHGQMRACCGSSLHEMVESYRLYCKNAIMFKEHVHVHTLVGHLQLALSLNGSTEDAYETFFGISKKVSEHRIIQKSIESNGGGINFYFRVISYRNKLFLVLMDGPDKEINEWYELAQKIDGKGVALFPRKVHEFFIDGMIGFSFARKYKDERERWEEVGNSMIAKFQRWKDSSEWNFANKLYLLLAERYFLQDDQEKAFKHYDMAIKASGDHRFLHEEGLANVAAAKCCLHYNKREEGLVYFAKAKDCYRRWGANALVSMIDKKCSEL